MVQKIIYRSSYLLILILLANSLLNLSGFNLSINIYDLILGLAFFALLLVIGNCIDLILNVQSISFSIFIYLTSFFVTDLLILFIYKSLSFSEVFVVTNVLWISVFIFHGLKTHLFIFLGFTYFLLNYLFYRVSEFLTVNENIIGDVEAVFFEQSKNIYEFSYFYSVNNFVMEGYPQFTSYLQALFLQFSQFQGSYSYHNHTSHIVFYLSILFFWELRISMKNKILLVTVFSSLILNSGWISFLFVSSLMSEGIVSLFTTVSLYYLFSNIRGNSYSKYTSLFYVIIGMLYFSKQFNSSIVLITIFIIFLLDINKKVVFFGFSGLFIKELLYMFVFSNVSKDHHIRQIDIIDTIGDLLLLRDLKFSNIFSILNNLFIDKPLVVVLVVFYLSMSLIFLQPFRNNLININLFLIVNLNLVLIFALYISAWQDMELDSPIRYILNLLHMVLISIFINLEKSKSN